MANSLLYIELSQHYKTNLERYVKEHPGEYILIEEPSRESFYKSESEMNDGIYKKYGDSMSYTIFSTQIPEKIPKRRENNSKYDIILKESL